MSQKPMQKLCQLFVLAFLVGVSVCRPNESLENQALADGEPSVSELEKLYNSFYRPLQYNTYDEPNSLERMQLQYRPMYQNSVFKSGAGNSGSVPMWDPYRQLITKRQARYRQCYFNPISCFRK